MAPSRVHNRPIPTVAADRRARIGHDEGGCDNACTGAGVWESSGGGVDASEFFGAGGGPTLLLTVQAYRPTNQPCPGGTTFAPNAYRRRSGRPAAFHHLDDGKAE